MSRIEAHPDAAIFPMMSQEELADLAADIKENGQRFPIIIGKHEDREVIVDGRNRFAACEMAGVEPKFEQINGHDPKAYILSVNINRRHMSWSQRHMAMAMMYPKPKRKGSRTGVAPVLGDDGDDASLSHARKVLGHSHALAEEVMSGTKSLQVAYDEYRLAQGKISNETIRLRKLRDTRPDLAERVVQAEITLDEAVAKEKREAEEHRQRRWAATKNLIEGVQLLDRDVSTIRDVVAQYDPAIAEQLGETITPERLRRVGTFVENLARHMAETTAVRNSLERSIS